MCSRRTGRRPVVRVSGRVQDQHRARTWALVPQQCHEAPTGSESGHDALLGCPLGGRRSPAAGGLGPLQDPRVERLTVAQCARLLLREGQLLEAAPGDLLQRDRGDPARLGGGGIGLNLLGQVLQGAGLVDAEGTDSGAPQRGPRPRSRARART